MCCAPDLFLIAFEVPADPKNVRAGVKIPFAICFLMQWVRSSANSWHLARSGRLRDSFRQLRGYFWTRFRTEFPVPDCSEMGPYISRVLEMKQPWRKRALIVAGAHVSRAESPGRALGHHWGRFHLLEDSLCFKLKNHSNSLNSLPEPLPIAKSLFEGVRVS